VPNVANILFPHPLSFGTVSSQNCVALEADDGTPGLFSYYVFQIPDEAPGASPGDAAAVFCSTLDQAFEVMHSKSVLEGST
jgi:hypothetical protein